MSVPAGRSGGGDGQGISPASTEAGLAEPDEGPRPGGRARPPIFLERRSYRRRRMMDAARILPILGALLFVVPLLWPRPDLAEPGVPTSPAFIYVFGLWAVLILISGLLSRSARRWQDEEAREPTTGIGI
ncbi:MAG: hypothetical protein ACU0AY_16880 [Marinibacterium profundimaris]